MDPEYFSSSPTVMAYDYATGDYFSPAYLGQQTPAQANAAAVRAVGPTGMEIAKPAPLVAHPVPGYPKVGHTPTFTMPMNKGDWNIRGVDIPTFSPALPRMPGSDWRTFPQPIDGAQLQAARPQFAAFAGIGAYGAMDYSRPGLGRSREVQDGAYRYRQFADGAIMILISPDPATLQPGMILTGTNSADPNYQRWVAITTKIGAWKDFAKARGASILQQAAQAAGVASTLAQTVVKPSKKGKRRAAAAPASMPPLPAETPPPDEQAGGMGQYVPWLIGGTVAVVGIVLLAKAFGGGSGKP